MNVKDSGRVVHGAVIGIEVWMLYAVAEYIMGTVGPVLHQDHDTLMAQQWRGLVVLLVCYAMIGSLLGAASAFLIDRRACLTDSAFERRSRAVTTLTMVIAFGINLFTSGLIDPRAPLAATFLIAAFLSWSVLRPDTRRFAQHPAAVIATLLASVKLTCGGWLSEMPVSKSLAISLSATLAMIGLAILGIRLTSRFVSRWSRSPILHTSFAVASSLGMIFIPGLVSSEHAVAQRATPLRPATVTRPNIILITLDTVRADHMGIYGYARQNTPNLTALLKDCSLYTDFSSTSTLTLTSHASIFTGLYPLSHGAYKEAPGFPTGRPLRTGIPTAASILGAAGYYTMAIAANRHYLRSEFGLLRDFEYSWTPRPQSVINPARRYLLRTLLRRFLNFDGITRDLDLSTITGDDVNRQAFAMLDKVSGLSAPFFLFLNYMDAHTPLVPPPPFDSQYPGRDPSFASWDIDKFMYSVNMGQHRLETVERDHLVSQYDGGIAYLDFSVGELVRNLKQRGLYDQTMIVITSDHGEALGEHGVLSHNFSLFQDQIHVPLLIKYPHRSQSETVAAPASHIDLLPTILDVAGLPIPQNLPGVSLVRAGLDPSRVVICERHQDWQPSVNGFTQSGNQFALLSGSLKYILSRSGVSELYDLAADPGELNNLYRPEVRQHAALSDSLKKWLRDTPRPQAVQPQVESEEIRRLHSIGYIQ